MNKKRTMKNLKEKGITLVALVVTIIILLILAGVTLNLALGEGGILGKAKNAADRYQMAHDNELEQMTELDKTLDKYSNGLPTEEITESGELAKELSKRLAKGEDGNSSVIGKTVTGLSGEVAGNYTWEIFYADENNIYLISTNYVKVADCPQKDSVSLTKGSSSYARSGHWENDLLDKYPNGSADISATGKKLNSDYFSESKNYSSTNVNIKAVAYLLDTDIWTKQFVGEGNSKVDYVIGCPSIELYLDAYNAKYGTSKKAKASSINGYQVSNDGKSFGNWVNYMIGSNDSTFLSSSTGGEARGLFFASPNNNSGGELLGVAHKNPTREDGFVGNIPCTSDFGFRPIVCLKSTTTLKELEDGTFKII